MGTVELRSKVFHGAGPTFPIVILLPKKVDSIFLNSMEDFQFLFRMIAKVKQHQGPNGTNGTKLKIKIDSGISDQVNRSSFDSFF